MTGRPALEFAGLLRQPRAQARVTQEELADALGLTEPARSLFVAAARVRVPAADVLAAGGGELRASAASATRALPRDIASLHR